MAVRSGIDTVKIKGRGAKSLENFVAHIKTEYPTVKNIEVVETIEEAVRGCDIVALCTSSPTGDPAGYPYVKEDWISPGTLFLCLASARFDEDFVLNRARTITDNIQLYEAWEEECGYPAYHTIPIPAVQCMDFIHDGKMKLEQIDDLGDILTGKTPAHRKEGEIIIYSIGGMPIEDVAWGTICYRNAVAKGIGTKLNLWDVPDLA
jgi:ornithine cyclodeaminase